MDQSEIGHSLVTVKEYSELDNVKGYFEHVAGTRHNCKKLQKTATKSWLDTMRRRTFVKFVGNAEILSPVRGERGS